MQFNPELNPEAKRILKGLYEFKNSLVAKGSFSRDEFLKGLKEIGIPSNMHFWAAILSCELPTQKCKLLTRLGKDSYVFTKPRDPIYHGDLQAIYDSYKGSVNKYAQNQKEKKRRKKLMDELLFGKPKPNEDQEKLNRITQEIEERENAVNNQLPKQIREAIDLLKSHGFEVLAPVATIYAKM